MVVVVGISGHFVKGVVLKEAHGEVKFSADVTATNRILRVSSAEDLRAFASELTQVASLMDEEVAQ